MPDKKSLAYLSVVCILAWMFVLGLLLPSDEPSISQNANILIVGTVTGISPSSTSGGPMLQLNDGERTWPCLLGAGVACPKQGELIIAYCESRQGDVLLITRIGAP